MMPINIFSIILTLLVTYLLCKRDTMHKRFVNLVSLAVIIHISAIRGYYLLLGKKTEVGYDLAISLILLVFTIVYVYRRKITFSKTGIVFSCFFVLVAMMSVLYEFFLPYENFIIDNATLAVAWDDYIVGNVVKVHVTIGWTRLINYFTFAFSYFIVLLALKETGTRDDLLCIVRRVNKFIPFVVGFVILEAIAKNVFGNITIYETIVEVIFGAGSSTFTGLLERGEGYYQLQGLSREPAHLAFMLYWGIIFILLEKKILTKQLLTISDKTKILLMSLVMIASGSFSTFIYLGISLIFSLWIFLSEYKIKRVYKICGMAMFIIAVIGVYNYFSHLDETSYLGQRIALTWLAIDLIRSGTGVGTGASSSLARFISLYDTGWDYLHRPILGLGPNVQVAHGGLINMLSDVGIAGVFCWWKASLSKYHYKFMPIIILLLFPNLILGVLTINTSFALYTPILIECFRKNEF